MYVHNVFCWDFDALFDHQILNENGFVGDVRDQSSDIQETLDTYDSPRLVKASQSGCL